MPRKFYHTESASQFTGAATLRKKRYGSKALNNENIAKSKYLPQVNSLYDMEKPCKLSNTITPVSDLIQPYTGYCSIPHSSYCQFVGVSTPSPFLHMSVPFQDRSPVQIAQNSMILTPILTPGGIVNYHNDMALNPYNGGLLIPGCVFHHPLASCNLRI